MQRVIGYARVSSNNQLDLQEQLKVIFMNQDRLARSEAIKRGLWLKKQKALESGVKK